MRKLPPLNALPAFEATVRLGSMSAAAQELGRTHGAVSKQIAQLSDLAGTPLFEKSGSGVKLTEEGALLAGAATPALDGLEKVWGDLAQRAQAPVLDIGISSTFAMRWLMPRLSRFYQRHPEAQVNFRMTGKVWLPDNAVDLVVTWDRLRWEFNERTDIEILGDVAFGVVHAPGLDVTVNGRTLTTRTRCVQELPGDVWGAYRSRTGVEIISETVLTYPHTFLVIEAALAGFGIALVERRIIEEEVQDGRLVAPFGFHTIKDGFGAVVTGRNRQKSLARAFLDWLREESADAVG